MTDSISKILYEQAHKKARETVSPAYGSFETEIQKLGKLGCWVTLEGEKMTMQKLIRKFRDDRIKAVAVNRYEKLLDEFMKKVDSIDLENANNQPSPGGTA